MKVRTFLENFNLVFFLVDGEIDLVNPKQKNASFFQINEGISNLNIVLVGSCFGDIDLLNEEDEIRMFTAKAMQDSEVLALNKTVCTF